MELPARCFYLPRPRPTLGWYSGTRVLGVLGVLGVLTLLVDSKRLNGRFRSRPSYDHPAVSGSPLVELHPREFVVALFHELRPLMRGLGSRAPLRRQTISSRVSIRRMYNHRSLPRTSFLFLRLNTTVFLPRCRRVRSLRANTLCLICNARVEPMLAH